MTARPIIGGHSATLHLLGDEEVRQAATRCVKAGVHDLPALSALASCRQSLLPPRQRSTDLTTGEHRDDRNQLIHHDGRVTEATAVGSYSARTFEPLDANSLLRARIVGKLVDDTSCAHFARFKIRQQPRASVQADTPPIGGDRDLQTNRCNLHLRSSSLRGRSEPHNSDLTAPRRHFCVTTAGVTHKIRPLLQRPG